MTAGACPSCGRAVPGVARFCPGCGAEVLRAAPGGAAPRRAPAAARAAEAAGGDPLVCPRCGRWRPCPSCLCPACMAGEPVPPRRPGLRFRWWKLLWFVGLGAVALAGKAVFTHSAGTLLLLVVLVVMVIVLRRTLAAGLGVLDRLAVLRPYWAVQRHVPKVLRVLGAIVVPVVLAFLVTPTLNRVFNGYGFLVFSSALAINTVAAHFILGPAPKGVRR